MTTVRSSVTLYICITAGLAVSLSSADARLGDDLRKQWQTEDRGTIRRLNKQVSGLQAEVELLKRTVASQKETNRQAITQLNQELNFLKEMLSNNESSQLSGEEWGRAVATVLQFVQTIVKDSQRWHAENLQTLEKQNRQMAGLQAEVTMLHRTEASLHTDLQRAGEVIANLRQELGDLKSSGTSRLQAQPRTDRPGIRDQPESSLLKAQDS